jgi:hypothetical protein
MGRRSTARFVPWQISKDRRTPSCILPAVCQVRLVDLVLRVAGSWVWSYGGGMGLNLQLPLGDS